MDLYNKVPFCHVEEDVSLQAYSCTNKCVLAQGGASHISVANPKIVKKRVLHKRSLSAPQKEDKLKEACIILQYRFSFS